MACYIASGKNRNYAALETDFGTAAAATPAHRFTSLGLRIAVDQERARRRDKTGTRTYQGLSGELRKRIRFEIGTYLHQRADNPPTPRYGAILEACLGGAPIVAPSGIPVTSAVEKILSFGREHGLSFGTAMAVGAEIRFVESAPTASTVILNAPFTATIAGMQTGGSISYPLAADLKSVTLYDHWTPANAIQRVLAGCAVDELRIELNGDYHELTFKGEAARLIDNRTFTEGEAGLTAFPLEPALEGHLESPIPGHLGQAWIGAGPEMLHTIKRARVVLRNNVDLRSNDFGSIYPRCFAPGDREVFVELDLYSQNKSVFDELYEAARMRTAVPLMLQLGNVPGGLCGLWLPAFIPEIPEFLDDEPRLLWRIKSSPAQGTGEDELHVAFA